MFAGDYYLGAVMQAYLPSFSPTFTLSRQLLVVRRTIHNQNKLSPKVAPLAVRYRTPFLSRRAFYKPDNTAKMFMTENGLKENLYLDSVSRRFLVIITCVLLTCVDLPC